MAEYWYRRKTWTKTDEEEFFARLKRTSIHREQYLICQAKDFIATKDDKLIDVAETLLKKLLTDSTEDRFSKRGSALCNLGNIYEHRQKYEKAFEYYLQAMDFEKKHPNMKTNAYIDYSELVIKLNKTSDYPFVEKIILDSGFLMFPLEKYKAAAILSIIYNYWHKTDIANEYAKIAMQNANAETSGLRYHKYFGLVKKEDRWLDKFVKK